MNEDKLQYEFVFEILKNKAHIKRIETVITAIALAFEALLIVLFVVFCSENQKHISKADINNKQLIEQTDSADTIMISGNMDQSDNSDKSNRHEENSKIYYYYLRF